MPAGLLVIPSIDIKDGKTVRVVQGIPELGCSKYNSDPVEMALIWRAENAKCIHVVDFDAAINNSDINLDLIGEICDSVVIPVEVGGGVNSFDTAKTLMEMGVFRLVIGTLAYENPDEFIKIIEKYGPSKIAAGVDVIDDNLVIKGRTEKTNINAFEFAKKLSEYGVKRIIVTDVNTNGMLSGPNLDLSVKIAQETGAKVTHSGGVSGFKDLMRVADNIQNGIDSVIIGRALYENNFPCQRIWRVAESGIFN